MPLANSNSARSKSLSVEQRDTYDVIVEKKREGVLSELTRSPVEDDGQVSSNP